MALNKEPVRLQALAFQAICSFTSQQFRRLLELTRTELEYIYYANDFPFPPDFNIDEDPYVIRDLGSSEAEVTAICDRLKQVLQTDVPPCIADDVTSAILRQFDDMHTELMDYTENIQTRIAAWRNVVAAILHPRIKTLDIPSKWEYVGDYILCELQCVPNLQTLKITCRKIDYITEFHNVFFRHIDHINIGRSLSHLEHLTLEFECSDEMLQGLSETCSQLKTLDINGSHSVTDVSVEYIKKFTHLKILNLKRTDINREAERNILSHLYNNSCQLQLYGCTKIDSSHLDTLLQLIPNIRELRTAFVNYGEPPPASASFHNLKILRIEFCEDYCYLQRLSKFVPYLEELEITVTSITIAMLRTWPKLNKLFLRTRYIQSDYPLDETYYSLEHLTLVTLHFDNEAVTLISHCPHLKTLELITDDNFYYDREDRVLNQMPNLEEISLGTLREHVNPEYVLLLSKRYKTTVLLEDSYFDILYLNYCPEVRVDTHRWLEITKPTLSEITGWNYAKTHHLTLFSLKE